jgi:hypothetical protein
VVNLSLVVNRSTRSRPNLMALLNGIRLVLLPRDSQEYGIDYEETFALIARITSICSLLAIAAVHQ